MTATTSTSQVLTTRQVLRAVREATSLKPQSLAWQNLDESRVCMTPALACPPSCRAASPGWEDLGHTLQDLLWPTVQKL